MGAIIHQGREINRIEVLVPGYPRMIPKDLMFLIQMTILGVILGVICLLLWFGIPYLYRVIQISRMTRKCREEGLIALTYDDGPSEMLTDRLSELLGSMDVKATFFMTGEAVEKRPDKVRRHLADGHLIGSHSYRHLHAVKSPPWSGVADSLKGIDSFQKIGTAAGYFRPPYGKATLGTLLACASKRCVPAWWTHDSGDTGGVASRVSVTGSVLGRFRTDRKRLERTGNDELMAQRTSAEAYEGLLADLVENGGVVLLHDSDRDCEDLEEHTLTVTRRIIEVARENGKRIIRIDELL